MSEATPVDPMDATKESSPIAGPVHDEDTIMLNTAKDRCVRNGRKFADGERVYDGSSVYECSYGTWVKQNA